MKTLLILIAGALFYAVPAGAQGGCSSCAAKATAEPTAVRTLPGTTEKMVVGRVENLMPIGVLAVLGCEPCTAQAVGWALQQGSSPDDVERAIKAVAAMQNLDCFKEKFGPDAATRLEKPLAAARKALQEAVARAAK